MAPGLHDVTASHPGFVPVTVQVTIRAGAETALTVQLQAVDLTNVRQTRFDPLLLPAQAPDGRWTTDVWAPLEGRVFNAGVRMEF